MKFKIIIALVLLMSVATGDYNLSVQVYGYVDGTHPDNNIRSHGQSFQIGWETTKNETPQFSPIDDVIPDIEENKSTIVPEPEPAKRNIPYGWILIVMGGLGYAFIKRKNNNE